MAIQRVLGSFRDPSGFVFLHQGGVFRAVDDQCHTVLRELAEEGRFKQLIRKQLLVGTHFIEAGELYDELKSELPQSNNFLQHELVPLVTYPYEWSLSMLADAAVHTLDLQLALLESGCSLKDATPYNIQFVDGHPRMIDVASIERPKRLDMWFALGQFLQMFLYPILLFRHRGWDLRSYFLGHLNGRPIEDVARSFTWLERLRPSLLVDLTLPLILHRWAEKSQPARRETLEQPAHNAQPQILNLKRLRKKIVRLASSYRTRGVWSAYASNCHYGSVSEAAKKKLVGEYLHQVQPNRVIDLGCNTGDYSYLAAAAGATVTSIDADHDAVEDLYRRLRKDPARVTPLLIDLANPSPSVGLMNQERAAFLERIDADCVLALALMHHLLVSANMPLTAIRDMFCSMTSKNLVLEFVPPEDAMFQRLMSYRRDLFSDVSLAACRAVFQERFELQKEIRIPESQRTLLFFRKLDG